MREGHANWCSGCETVKVGNATSTKCQENPEAILYDIVESGIRLQVSTPDKPDHYSRIKALTGVETWDILDFIAGGDPDMWNLGKYWFRLGHKEGQSTLTEKKKMLKYLERSIAKEEQA